MLMQRTLSAIVGIMYIILMLYMKGWFFKISVLVMALILMHEFYRAFTSKGYKPIKGLGYLLILLLFYSNFVSLRYSTITLMAIVIITGLAISIFSKGIGIIDVLITVFAALYPSMMIFFLIPLAFDAEPYGMNLLVLTFLVTWSTDTFAYFIGNIFGKNGLCPSISPNKTVEGSIGGLVGSIVVGLLFGVIINPLMDINIGLHHFAIIGLIGGVLSQLGDLSASSIKRFCGVKDFGWILPGHGGLLDRFDSLLFTLPVIYIYYLTFL